MSTRSPKVYGNAGPFAIEATADLRKSMARVMTLSVKGLPRRPVYGTARKWNKQRYATECWHSGSAIDVHMAVWYLWLMTCHQAATKRCGKGRPRRATLNPDPCRSALGRASAVRRELGERLRSSSFLTPNNATRYAAHPLPQAH
jgi:hypothetical protein